MDTYDVELNTATGPVLVTVRAAGFQDAADKAKTNHPGASINWVMQVTSTTFDY